MEHHSGKREALESFQKIELKEIRLGSGHYKRAHR